MKRLSTFCISLLCFTLAAQAQIWEPMGSGLTKVPVALTTINSKILVAAYKIESPTKKETHFGIAYWNGTIWQHLPKIVCDSGSHIYALKFFKNNLYIAGKFSRFAGLSNPRNIVRWNTLARKYETVPAPSTSIKTTDAVLHLGLYKDLLVVGGSFTNTEVAGGHNLGFYTGEKWASSGIKELENINGPVRTTVVRGDDFYIGGSFSKVSNQKTKYMVRFRNGELYPFDKNTTGPFFDLINTPSRLIAPGSSVAGQYPNRFYKIFGDSAYNMSPENVKITEITDMVPIGNTVFASGRFNIDNKDIYLIKWENEKWSAFEGGSPANLRHMVGYKDSLVVAGIFESYRDIKLNRVAQVRPNTPMAVIQGQVFFDKNGNDIKDNRDEPLNDRLITIEPGNIVIRPRDNGRFTAFVKPGTYEIQVADRRYWNHFPEVKIELAAGEIKRDVNFPLTQKSGVKDLSVKLIGGAGAIVNVNNRQQYFIQYENLGSSEVEKGTVSLKFDSKLSSLTADPMPRRIIGDSAVWDISALWPGEQGVIRCVFDVTGDAQEDLNLTASISQPKSEDEDDNNTSSLTQQLVDQDIDIHKFVNPGLATSDTAYLLPDSDNVLYQISFANYTPDTVHTIYVVDTIPLNASIKSIDDVSFSHPMVDASYPGPPFSNYYVLVYKFEDIDLPPNPTRNGEIVTDEGHASFQLTLKNNLVDGQQFLNTATVVFDHVFEKQTNTVTAIVDEDLVSAPSFEVSNTATLYPNPTEGLVYLDQATEEFTSYKVFTFNGQLAQEGELSLGGEIDLRQCESGIYILQLDGGSTAYRTKLIKL
ncbi:MAG: T9SS type A sorting domain-containing protein [Bacteroidia bacterium]|nr:T9SS type A sorting domain-containing protein [Bacteroidia bacterium]